MGRGTDVTDKLDQLIADSLKIAPEDVTDDLAYGSLPGWDSLAHVSLMLQLEAEYDVEIDEDTMVELTSVAAIRDFVQGVAA
jgi:acyl carrier protein